MNDDDFVMLDTNGSEAGVGSSYSSGSQAIHVGQAGNCLTEGQVESIGGIETQTTTMLQDLKDEVLLPRNGIGSRPARTSHVVGNETAMNMGQKLQSGPSRAGIGRNMTGAKESAAAASIEVANSISRMASGANIIGQASPAGMTSSSVERIWSGGLVEEQLDFTGGGTGEERRSDLMGTSGIGTSEESGHRGGLTEQSIPRRSSEGKSGKPDGMAERRLGWEGEITQIEANITISCQAGESPERLWASLPLSQSLIQILVT